MTDDEFLDAVCDEMAKLRDCKMYFRTPQDSDVARCARKVALEEAAKIAADKEHLMFDAQDTQVNIVQAIRSLLAKEDRK